MAMDFLQAVQQQNQRMEDNSNNSFEDEGQNKVPDITLGKKNPHVTVRILPSRDPQNPLGFAKLFRKIFITTPRATKSGNPLRTMWVLPTNPEEGMQADGLISRWQQEGKLEGRFGTTRPQLRAIMNVIVLDNNNNPEIDPATGQPKVSVIETSYGVYKDIVSQLSDPRMVTPETPEGFIGADVAYPVSIEMKNGQPISYDVRVYLNAQLPAIPGGHDWVGQFANNLDDYTQPSETLAPHFFQTIVEAMDEPIPGQGQQASAPEPQAAAQQSTPAPQAQQANPWAQPVTQAQAPAQPANPWAQQAPAQQAAPAQQGFASQSSVADSMVQQPAQQAGYQPQPVQQEQADQTPMQQPTQTQAPVTAPAQGEQTGTEDDLMGELAGLLS